MLHRLRDYKTINRSLLKTTTGPMDGDDIIMIAPSKKKECGELEKQTPLTLRVS